MQDRLMSELKEATRKGNRVRQAVIRLTRAEIQNAEIAQGKALDDSAMIDILSREVKKRRESIEQFEKGKRQDLVAKEKAELAILLEYLPPQLSRDEIEALARNIIDEVGARGPGDRGRVMGKLMPQVKGKAEGKLVSEVVTELLAGS